MSTWINNETGGEVEIVVRDKDTAAALKSIGFTRKREESEYAAPSKQQSRKRGGE
jgi:hypothetical protein